MTLIFLSVNTSLMFSNVYIPQRRLSGLVLLPRPSSDSGFFRTGVSVSNGWQKEKEKKSSYCILCQLIYGDLCVLKDKNFGCLWGLVTCADIFTCKLLGEFG